MGYEAKKTEHAGAKRGRGAYWGRKYDAKKESNKMRRRISKKEIQDQLLWKQSLDRDLTISLRQMRQGKLSSAYSSAEEFIHELHKSAKQLQNKKNLKYCRETEIGDVPNLRS
jgi:hypothetical protein